MYMEFKNMLEVSQNVLNKICYMQVYTYIHTKTYTNIYTQVYIIHIHKHIHICVHTCIHIQTHIYHVEHCISFIIKKRGEKRKK